MLTYILKSAACSRFLSSPISGISLRYLIRSICRVTATSPETRLTTSRPGRTLLPPNLTFALVQRGEANVKSDDKVADQKFLLRDRIMTVPNGLCVLRIGLTPVVGYLVVHEYFLAACSLFVIAGLTDLLDGFIARRVPGQSSTLGSVIDPLADKFLVTTLFITLTYVNLIPAVLTVLVLLRDLCLITGGIVKRLKSLMPPVTLRRFFNPSISPMRVTPTLVSKVNTALQLGVIAGSLASPVLGFVGHPWLSALYAITGVTTVYSGLQYARLDRMKRV